MSLTSSPPATKPVRRRRWLRYTLAIVTVAAAAAGLVYVYVSWSFESEMRTAIAETEALDPRWRLEHIEEDRKTYRDEENAALQTIVVAKLIGRGRNAIPNHPNYDDLFHNYPPERQLNAVQMNVIGEAFDRIEEARLEARKLKDMPGGRFPIKYSPDFISTLMPNQQDARQSMHLLQHDAMFRAQNGDADGALESCMALLNAGRSLGDEPLLISYLIHIAGDTMTVDAVERALAQGFPKPAPLEEMQRRLAQERADARHHWQQSMRGERAGHHELAQVIMSGKLRMSMLIGLTGRDRNVLEFFQDQFPLAFARGYPSHLRYLNETVEATKLPDAEQIGRMADLEQSIPSQSTFTRLLAPAMAKVVRAHVRTQANLGAAEFALACERFRIEHKRWPESLEELVKAKMVEALAPDPCDGAPLRYRKLADGVVIYSIGFDKEDNEGNINRHRPEEAGTDLGVRLWEPARRRQPPLPPVLRQQ
jgi:hypothetical protein